jgi:hypothetical protein
VTEFLLQLADGLLLVLGLGIVGLGLVVLVWQRRKPDDCPVCGWPAGCGIRDHGCLLSTEFHRDCPFLEKNES